MCGRGQSLYLAHLSPLEVILAKRRRAHTDQKGWGQGFDAVPAESMAEVRGRQVRLGAWREATSDSAH